MQVEALPEPVVVAYATLRQRDLPSMASIAENQSQIAKHLVSNTTNLQAIYDEFEKINNRSPLMRVRNTLGCTMQRRLDILR